MSDKEVVYDSGRARFSSAKIAVIARALSTRLSTSSDKKCSSPADGDTIGDMIKQLLTLDDEHDKEMITLRRDLSAATKLLGDKDRELAILKTKIEVLYKKKSEDAQRILNLDVLVKSQGRTLISNRIEIEALKKEVEPLRDAVTARENAHNSQSSLVAELERVNAGLKRKYKLLHQQMDVEIQKLRAAQFDKSDLVRQIGNYKKTIAELKAACTNGCLEKSATTTSGLLLKDENLKQSQVEVENSKRPVLAEKTEGQVNDENCLPETTDKPLKEGKNQATVQKVDTLPGRKVRVNSVLPEGEVVRRVSIKSVTSDLAQAVTENAKLREKLDKAKAKIKKTNPLVQKLQRELGQTKKKLEKQQNSSENLQKQLNKVVAEYKAVAVAHEYANAEVSKLRQELRAPPTFHKHGIRGGVDCLLRPRKH